MKGLVYFISLLLFFSCSPKKQIVPAPEWVKIYKHSGFPDFKYIQGIGTAQVKGNIPEAVSVADQVAINKIASQIRINIEATTKTAQEEKTLFDSKGNMTGASSSKVERNEDIKTSVNLKNIEGLSIKERYLDEKSNIYYSFAVLDVEQASLSLESKIRSAQDKIKEYYSLAEKSLKKEEDPVNYVKNLVAALSLSKGNREYEELLFALVKNRIKFENSCPTLPILEGSILECLKKFHINKLSGDNQVGDINRPLQKPISVQMIYEGEKSKPISGFPVAFSFRQGNGKIQQLSITDSSGEAKADVYNVLPVGSKHNQIAARANFEEIVGGEISFTPIESLFSYTMPTKEELKLGVYISENNNGKKISASVVQAKLAEKLVKSGFSIKKVNLKELSFTDENIDDVDVNSLIDGLKPKFDIFVHGIVFAEYKGSNPFVSFESKAMINIYDLKTGIVFKSIEFSPFAAGVKNGYDTKGVGNSEIQASQNSLQKIGEVISQKISEEMEVAFNKGFQK